MNLGALLALLRETDLHIHLRGEVPVLRGAPGASPASPEVRAAIAEHRPHLLRLARSDARAARGGAGWRGALAAADDDTREAWALVAHGIEQAHGMAADAAEALAWEEVTDA